MLQILQHVSVSSAAARNLQWRLLVTYSGGSSHTLRATPPYIHRPGAPKVYARSNRTCEYSVRHMLGRGP